MTSNLATAPERIDFLKRRFADAEIVSFRSLNGDLELEYVDWQERPVKLKFEEAVGYEAFSPEGVSLSHATTGVNDPLIVVACTAAGEDNPSAFQIFSFVSAWTGVPVLRIVAKEVWAAV